MKVKFPRFIDRSRLLFIFEMDMIGIFAVSTIASLWTLSKVLPNLLAIPLAFYIGYKAVMIYNVAKYEKSPGFLRHYFYNIGIFKPKKDFEKYPELKERDNENFYPSGYIREFRD